MIFDAKIVYNADPHAKVDIVDLDTGQSLSRLPIFYADDETGVYRLYLEDEQGSYYDSPDTPGELAWEERRGNIRITVMEVAELP